MTSHLIRNACYWAVVSILGLAVATANARTIYVPDDYPTIQEAIDGTIIFDTVIVRDGTYTGEGNKDLDFGGKLITVRSENGPDNCIIDCEDSGRGFYFHNAESDLAIVTGFTIKNGHAGNGGAIACQASDPTIDNCWIMNCSATKGGAVWCYDRCATVIRNCRITGNYARWGGGIYCDYLDGVTIVGCYINGNNVSSSYHDRCGGAGIYCGHATVVIGCTISENTADYRGSGWGGAYGAGVYGDAGATRIVNTTITDNVATANNTNAWGGGIYCRENDAHIVNSVVARNYSKRAHGGVGLDGGDVGCTVYVRNCTVADNEAGEKAGGVGFGNAVATLCNSILWANSAPSGPELALFHLTELAVSYSDVRYGQSEVYQDDNCTLAWGDGNIDENPLFVDPGNDDYRLWCLSPCIDAGNNECVPLDELDLDEDGETTEKIPYDLMGNLRFVDDPNTADTGNPDPNFPELPIVDMGAYEFQACDGDLDCDGDTDHSDLGILLGDWGCTGGECPGDLDGDGDTDHSDLGILLGNWGCGT